MSKLFLFSPEGRQYLLVEYGQKERSAAEIAEELQTYPKLVLRALIFHGIPRRDHSAAQAAALARGRSPHPTQGKPRPPQVRSRIREGMTDVWKQRHQAGEGDLPAQPKE